MTNENDRWICGSIKISLSDIERARDLRVLFESIQLKLKGSSEKGINDEYEIIREKVVLLSIERELYKINQKMLSSDLETQ